jgi:holliday junction DNA helicase RuvB
MARETILQPDVPPADEDRDLRPQRMRDMVGQRDVHERLGIAVDAAAKRGEPLGHILLGGLPPLGGMTQPQQAENRRVLLRPPPKNLQVT